MQVSTFNSHQLKLLNLTVLVQALRNDPDLAHIDPYILPKVLQVLYAASRCDYISFLSQLGKASFVRISSSMHHLFRLGTNTKAR